MSNSGTIANVATIIGGAGASLSAANASDTTQIIVAASDSSDADKAKADYVCTGQDDDIVIQRALDALPSTGGTVVLLPGHYSLAGTISPNSYDTLEGYGAVLQPDLTSNIHIVVNITKPGSNHISLIGFTVDGEDNALAADGDPIAGIGLSARDVGAKYITAKDLTVQHVSGERIYNETFLDGNPDHQPAYFDIDNCWANYNASSFGEGGFALGADYVSIFGGGAIGNGSATHTAAGFAFAGGKRLYLDGFTAANNNNIGIWLLKDFNNNLYTLNSFVGVITYDDQAVPTQTMNFLDTSDSATNQFIGTSDPFQLALSNFTVGAGGWSDQNTYPRELGDVNGDGRAEVVGFGQDGVWVSLANSDGSFTTPKLVLGDFGTAAGNWTSEDKYPRLLADVNGDGTADIVGFGPNDVWVSLADGSGGFGSASFVLGNFGTDAGGWSSENTYPRQLGDVNGDGKADIIGFGQDGVWEALATGSGGFADPKLVLDNFAAGAGGWSDQNTYPRELGDVNGDGRDDIVGFGQDGVWVSLANADGTFTTPKLVLSDFAVGAGGWTSDDKYPRLLADLNGDGKSDIVGFGQDGVWVALSNGDGTFGTPTFDFNDFGFSASAGSWSSQNTYPREAADVTGGGASELVGFGYSGVFIVLSTATLPR